MMSGRQRTSGLPPVARDCPLDHLERCWLSAHNEAAALKSECQLLEQVFQVVQADWRQAQERLAQSEALRDALGAQCMSLLQEDGADLHALPPPESRSIVA